jgi:hypothetical protein
VLRTHVPGRPIGTLDDARRPCVGTGRSHLAVRRDRHPLALVQARTGDTRTLGQEPHRG